MALLSLPEPGAFLGEVDAALDAPVNVICIGGFVLAAKFGLPRPTADVDFVEAVPGDGGRRLLALAGRGTELAKRHGLYFQHVGIWDLPDDHRDRLVQLAPNRFALWH
jgi:hypothetical protein